MLCPVVLCCVALFSVAFALQVELAPIRAGDSERVSLVTVLRRAMVDTDFIADGILEVRDDKLLEILSPDLR